MSESEEIMIQPVRVIDLPGGGYLEANQAIHIDKTLEFDEPRPARGKELEEHIELRHRDIQEANREIEERQQKMQNEATPWLVAFNSQCITQCQADVRRYELEILAAERQLHKEQHAQPHPSEEHQANIERAREDLNKLEQQKIRNRHETERLWQAERERLRSR